MRHVDDRSTDTLWYTLLMCQWHDGVNKRVDVRSGKSEWVYQMIRFLSSSNVRWTCGRRKVMNGWKGRRDEMRGTRIQEPNISLLLLPYIVSATSSQGIITSPSSPAAPFIRFFARWWIFSPVVISCLQAVYLVSRSRGPGNSGSSPHLLTPSSPDTNSSPQDILKQELLTGNFPCLLCSPSLSGECSPFPKESMIMLYSNSTTVRKSTWRDRLEI